MKDLTITAIIKVYQYDELNEGDRSLIKTAMEATARSYSPYSHFSVGAAADQPVVTLAIAARTEKDFIDHPIPPCGACRQVILETEKRYKQPIRILLYGKECIYEVKSIGDLLPLSFDASAMED